TGGTVIDDPFTDTMRINVSFFRGGNPGLRPEYADTHVLGFVFEPAWLEGFQLSTDWYEIEITDAVDSITEQQVIDQCFDIGALCDNLIRDNTGTLVAVHAPFMNLAASRAEGIDMELVYRMEPDFVDGEFESLSLRALFGHLIENSTTPPGGQPIDRVGSSARPENTGILTAIYGVGPWSFSWQQRYIDQTKRNINWVEGVDID